MSMNNEKRERHRYLRQKHKDARQKMRQEKKKLKQTRVKQDPSIHSGEMVQKTESDEEKATAETANEKPVVKKVAMTKRIKAIMTQAYADTKGKRLLSVPFVLLRLFAIYFGGALMMTQTELFLDNVYYHATNPGYHEPTNQFAFWFGFLIFFAALIISKIYMQASLYLQASDTAAGYLKQYTTVLVSLVFIQYGVELLLFGLLILALFLTELWANPLSYWPETLRVVWPVVYLILAFVSWTYLQLLLPMAMKKTLGIKQALTDSLKFWYKNLSLITCIILRQIPYDLFEFFTANLASVYIYPLKLSIMNNLIRIDH